MNYKCQYCDPVTRRGEKPVKSINIEEDDFIKLLTGKYYHTECYREYLRNQTKTSFSEEEIDSKILEIKKRQEEEIQEAKEKDKFLQYIMDLYDCTLNSYFLKKVNAIRKGEDEKVSDEVTYFEMLEIYQYMKGYLNKASSKKAFQNKSQRMNYELAIVVGNIGDYREYKQKMRERQEDEQQTDHSILQMDKVNIKNLPKKKKKDEGITREDMDDLLL